MKLPVIILSACLTGGTALASTSLAEGVSSDIELQAAVNNNTTPLWLHANTYGLSSSTQANGYARGRFMRDLANDSLRHWGVGYGADLVIPTGYKTPGFTHKLILQQAYADIRYKHAVVTLGAKQQPMELKNNRLSSGSQTLGINARPIPQARIGFDDYWHIPGLGQWAAIKGFASYGMMTDGQWQKDFTMNKTNWAKNVLYHTKAGYLRIGNESKFPFSLELGLEMGSQFGGTAVHYISSIDYITVKIDHGPKAFLHAFTASGYEWKEEGIVYQNAEGNQLGSWVGRINYSGKDVQLGFYFDHFFEDHSAMFFLDYDGYGHGDEWDTKKETRFFQYRLKDILLGLDAHFSQLSWLSDVTVEFINTKYQSGPVYHDHTPNISHHISGNDDYYNHSTYAGWSYYGRTIGNALYSQPSFNADRTLRVRNNRFTAVHLGAEGAVTDRLGYRLLATWQDGLGSYLAPFTRRQENFSMMLEGTLQMSETMKNLSLRLGLGFDSGSLYGDNVGAQFTINYRIR